MVEDSERDIAPAACKDVLPKHWKWRVSAEEHTGNDHAIKSRRKSQWKDRLYLKQEQIW